MAAHPLDGKDLRKVLLGYEHLSSYWKAELYWQHSQQFLLQCLSEGITGEELIAAGLGAFCFMTEFCSEAEPLGRLTEEQLEVVWDAAAKYRDFMGDEFSDDNLPWTDQDDLTAYLDYFAEWLRANSQNLSSSLLRSVVVSVWRTEDVIV
jgi:hypothetical protein